MIKRSFLLSLLLVSAFFFGKAQEPTVAVVSVNESKSIDMDKLQLLKQVVIEGLDKFAQLYHPDNKEELIVACDLTKNLYINIYDLLKSLSLDQALKIKMLIETMIHSFIDSANEEQKAALHKVLVFLEMISKNQSNLFTADQKLQIKENLEKIMNIVKSNSESAKFVDNIENLYEWEPDPLLS